MAQRTQMRLHAITGSIPAIDSVSSSPAVPSAINAENMLDVMGQVAGAIKRITGAATFTEQAAGQFSHALTGSHGLKLGGDLDVNAPADFQGAVNLQAGLTVGGAADLNGSLDVQGAVGMQSTLAVTGAADFLSTLDVVGAVQMDSTLALAGNADFNGDLDVSGSSDLHGAVKAWGALTVEGAIDANSSADFQGAVNLQSTLTVAGAIDANGSADFQGAVQFQSTINVDGTATLASAVVEDLTPGRIVYVGTGDALVDSEHMTYAAGVLTVSGSTFSKDVSIAQDLTVSRDVSARSGSFSGDLVVAGDLVINGTTTTVNSTVVTVDDKAIELGATASPSDITADGGGIILKGSTDKTILWSNTSGAWEINDDLLPSADNSYDLGADAKRWQDLYLEGAADIDGNADVAGTLTIGGAATFNGLVDVNAGLSASLIKIDGDTATRLYIVDADGSMKDEAKLTFDGSELLVDAALEVSGAADLNGALDVAGASDLHGAVYAYSTLRADGAVDFNAAMDVAGASDLHGAVRAYDALRVDGAADFKSSMLVTGSVDMLSTFHAVGAATLDSTLFVDGAVTLSGSMDLVDAGLQTITKQGGDLRINVAAGELLLSDKWNDASAWSADSIALSDSAAEWDNFKAAFGGEVSLLNAIVAANGGTAGGKFKKVITSAVNAGTAVAGSTIAKMAGAGDFAAGYAGLTAGTEKNKVDVYVNGQLMLEGASDDYEISAGDITFKFDLFVDDVILAIVR